MNKRRIFASAALFILLASVAAFMAAPGLLRLENVRQRLATELSRATGADIDFSRVDFVWFPVPRFRISQVDIRSAGTVIYIPEIIAHPDLDFIAGRKNLLRRLEVIRPRVSVGTAAETGGDTAFPALPAATTIVRRATLEIPRIKGWTAAAIRFTGLNMEISERGTSLALKLRGKGGVGRSIRLSLFLDRKRKKFSGNFNAEKLDPALLAPAALEGRIKLLKAPVDLNGSFEGGADALDINVTGVFPCFRYRSENGAGVTVECGTTAFSIHHDSRESRIDIKRLDLSRPAMSIHGSIIRFTGDNSPLKNAASAVGFQRADKQTRWRIDLAGTGMDLGAVRKDILTLWPDNHVVKTVCEIVSGGRAAEGSFFFEGPPARLAHLEDMRIGARVTGADIHPPHTQLFLTGVTGTIRIENGYLSGSELTANLGNSRGTDGALRMDLLHRDRAFALDLAINADLAGLPTVLDGLVASKTFRNELARFKQVSGNGSARLRISGALPHPLVRVSVKDIDARAVYGRLPWPVRLRGGGLEIGPERVTWRGISGTAGPHRVTNTSGEVRWDGGRIRMAVRDTAARLDGADLLAVLTRFAGQGKGAAVVESLSGPIGITAFSLEGNPADPAGWHYAMQVEAKGIRWRSPLLPGEYLTEHIRARVSDRRITVDESRTWNMEQPISLSADIRHRSFRVTGLEMTLNGTVRERLGKWVVRQGWLPESLLPATPLTLRGFRISFRNGQAAVTGRIIAGAGKRNATAADIELTADKATVDLKKLTVRGHGSVATLSLRRQKATENENAKTTVKWEGSLAGESVADLLAAPELKFGRVSGRGSVAMESGSMPRLQGTIEAADIHFPAGSGITTVIDIAEISGKQGKEIEIKKLHLNHGGQTVRISGWLDPGSHPPGFDLTATAREISLATLTGIKQELPESGGQASTGTFRFDFGRLDDIYGPVAGKGLTMRPARGELRIGGGGWQTLKVSRSRLCGLEFDGIFHHPDSRLETSFNLYSDGRRAEMPEFEQVLPCLGFKNDVVKGRVAVDANLAGRLGKWRTGRLNLYSRKGFIRRLSVLSKALSLLNITGIISGTLVTDLDRKGFSYSELEVKSHVKDNHLIVDKAVIRGSGLNIFASGDIDIINRDCDIVMLLAPLKAIDTILGNLPIIGRAMGGRDTAIVAVPVKITGKIDDPDVKILAAKEVGEGIINFVTRTIKLPFALLSPLVPGGDGQKGE